jgi:hypothetical protein
MGKAITPGAARPSGAGRRREVGLDITRYRAVEAKPGTRCLMRHYSGSRRSMTSALRPRTVSPAIIGLRDKSHAVVA